MKTNCLFNSIIPYAILIMMLISSLVIIPVYADSEDPGDSGSDVGTRGTSRSFLDWPKLFGGPTNDGNVHSFGPLHNTTLWNFTTGAEVFSSPTIADGKLFIGSWDKHLYALDPLTGKELWKFNTGDFIYTSATYDEGVVYIGTGIEIGNAVRKLYALNAATGSEIWSHQFEGNIYGSAVVHDGEVFVGDGKGTLYALDAQGNGDSTTTVKRSFKAGFEIWSLPAISNDSIFFTTTENKLFRLNLTTFAEIWNFSGPSSFEGSYASPTIDELNGRVYFGSAVQPEGRFYAISLETGKELWNISTGTSRYGVCTTAALYGDMVLVGSNNGYMYALDAATGDEEWKFLTGDTYQGIYSSPTVAAGHLYFGSTDGMLYCLNAKTGDKVWSFKTGGGEYGVVSTPAVLDGMVYFGGNDWEVYAIGTPRTGDIQLEVTYEPEILGSGEDATISVKTFNGTNPLGWVQVRLTAPVGSLSKMESRGDDKGTARSTSSRTSVLIGTTDLNGEYKCTYTALGITQFTNVRIELEASGTGLTSNSTDIDLIVNPNKQLELSFEPTKSAYFMGEPITVAVNVSAGGEPVDSALVKYIIEYNGEQVSDFGIADFLGIFDLVYTAPTVSVETDLEISVNATKPGYISALDTFTIKVLPQAAYGLDITVSLKDKIVNEGSSTEITITVKNGTGGDPVPGAGLLMSVLHGSLADNSGVTGTDGSFTITYTAPQSVTLITTVEFKVKVSKIDFNDMTVSHNITVSPKGEGDGNGGDDNDERGFLSSPGFYISLTLMVIVIMIAVIILMQAKKKQRATVEKPADERVDEEKEEEKTDG